MSGLRKGIIGGLNLEATRIQQGNLPEVRQRQYEATLYIIRRPHDQEELAGC
jgi:hypothetical protein